MPAEIRGTSCVHSFAESPGEYCMLTMGWLLTERISANNLPQVSWNLFREQES